MLRILGFGGGSTFTTVVSLLAAIAATVLLCIKVIPAKKDGTFQKPLMQKAHDFFNFKKLYVESILKVIYAFCTIFAFVSGILTAVLGNFIFLISRIIDWADMGEYARRYVDGFWSDTFVDMLGIFFGGILAAILIPVILRITYELVMMFVLLVKNTIEINNKLKKQD